MFASFHGNQLNEADGTRPNVKPGPHPSYPVPSTTHVLDVRVADRVQGRYKPTMGPHWVGTVNDDTLEIKLCGTASLKLLSSPGVT